MVGPTRTGTPRELAEGVAAAWRTASGASVDRARLVGLAEAGLLGLHAPAEVGGLAATPGQAREVQEVLAGADLQAWFVQVQHHAVVRAVTAAVASQGRGDLAGVLADLASGRTLAGIAFAHLRRFPDDPVRATAAGAGYVLDGGVDWYTGWGVNDVALVGARTADDLVVLTLLAARENTGADGPGDGGTLLASPLPLAAMAGTGTVRLALDHVRVSAQAVVAVLPGPDWREADRLTAANAVPAVFGVAQRACDLLDDLARRRDEPAAAELAAALRGRVARARDRAYACADAAGGDDPGSRDDLVRERLDARAQAHGVLRDAAAGVVVAAGGAGTAQGHPAQVLLSDATFLLVQASTAAGRDAVLRSWARVQDS